MNHNICRNCGSEIAEQDKYCRVCGTQKEANAFTADENMINTIYGAMPIKRKRIYGVCGYSWVVCNLADSREYCPRCGGKTRFCDELGKGRID